MTGTRFAIAMLIYVLGTLLACATAVNGLTDSSPVEWVLGPAMGLGIWWIAAGIGVRLGATPREYAAWLRSCIVAPDHDHQ
jgi:hypothetical protein